MKLIIFLLLVTACSHKPTVQQPSAFEEAMKSESQDLTLQKVTTPDGSLSIQVMAKSVPAIQFINDKNKYYYVTIDIGSNIPVECFLYGQEMHPALTIKKMAETVLNDEKSLGKMAKKQITLFSSGAIQGFPFHLLNITYLTAQNKAGYLKSMSGLTENGLLSCLHNEVGYSETFIRRFTEILTSITIGQEVTKKPGYKEIFIYQMNNIPIGFSMTYEIEGADKKKVLLSKESMLMPISAEDVSTYDSAQTEVSLENGILQYGRYVVEENLTSSHAFEISSTDGKEYQVKGFKDGKYISGKIATEGLIAQRGYEKLLVQKFFDQGLQHFSIPVYSPSNNPLAPTKLRSSIKQPKQTGATVRMEMGKSIWINEVEANGRAYEMSMPAGTMEVKGKRIFPTN